MTDLTPSSKAFRFRPLVAGLAALIPLIPIVIALLLSSTGGGGASVAAASPSTRFTPVPVTPPLRRNLLLPSGRGSLVAGIERQTAMRSSPGGRVYAKVPIRTGFGSPQVMSVVRLSGRWLGVVSTIAGNGRVGWIPASAASLSRVNWTLKVSLARRELTVLENGKAVEHYSVAVGRPSAPPPTGRFAVTDRLNTGDPGGPYGCCILALSAKSPHAIQGWSGGDRIAIHSTIQTSTIGEPVSHGCLRLTLAEGKWLLDHIPLGTPALISS